MNFKTVFMLGVSVFFAACVSSTPFNAIPGGQIKLLKQEKSIKKELVRVEIEKGLFQRLLIFSPENSSHILMMFTGGDGRLGLSDSGAIRHNSNNFTVRIIDDMVNAGFMVALVDAPEDMQGMYGMYSGSYRVTESHYLGISKIYTYIKERNNIPVWLLGFSMGNHSATYLAGRFKNKIDGLIIASSSTKWTDTRSYSDYPGGILDIYLDQITVPALILHHKNDRCRVCPSDNVPLIKKALIHSPNVAVKLISGGVTHSVQCGPLGHHGFRGKEQEAIEAIINFVKSN